MQAFDGHNTGRLPVTVTVENVEEAPQIRFSQIRPVVGVRIIASLYDPEVSSPGNLDWEWQGGGSQAVTSGLGGKPSATSPGFTPTRDGSILQVIATYVDSEGNTQRINSITAGAGEEIVRPNPADQDPPQPNDPPEFTQDTYSFTVQEDAASGATVGTAGATDDDTFSFSGHGTIADQDALHYSLDAASAAVFDIDRTSGAIAVRAPLDFETKSTYTATVTVTDSMRETDTATVTITVTDVNEPPEITTSKDVYFVGSGRTNPVTTFRATDPERGEITWSLSGTDSGLFTLDPDTGVLTFNDPPVHDPNGTNSWDITVTATDPDGNTDQLQVTVAVTGEPPSAGPSGPPSGGPPGGGFPGGFGPPPEPEPSDEDLEWNITRDIESLGEDHGSPTGMWGSGNVLWILQNGTSGADYLYAYDRASGERLTDLRFELDRANRASHGVWSDGEIVWIADAEADKLFAYELDSGERAEDRDFALDESNLEPRGIWSDGETFYVLNAGQRGLLFAYDIATASLLDEYRLHNTINTSPRGIWSDGVTIWTSDEKYSGLVAYRWNEQDNELVRHEVEEFPFRELIASSNTDARGIWSDGNVMYVVDAEEEEQKVYSYNMPDAIVATLDSISVDGVTLKSFSADRLEYAVEVGATTRLLTVEAVATVAGASVMIEPPDGDRDPSNGHTVVVSRVGAR